MLAELDGVSEDVLPSLRQDFHILCEPHEGLADVLKFADLPKWFTDADKFNEMFPITHAQDYSTGGSLWIGGKRSTEMATGGDLLAEDHEISVVDGRGLYSDRDRKRSTRKAAPPPPPNCLVDA